MKVKIISVFVLLLLVISSLPFSAFAVSGEDYCTHQTTYEMGGDADSFCNVTVYIMCSDCGAEVDSYTESFHDYSGGSCSNCGASDPDYDAFYDDFENCSHPDYYEHKTESGDSCVFNIYYCCVVCDVVLEQMSEESHSFLSGLCINCGAADPDYVDSDCPHESTYEMGGDHDSFCDIIVSIMCSDCGAEVGRYTESFHEYSGGHCIRCGAPDPDYGDTETCTHSWDFGYTISPSTCSAAGQVKYTCVFCGETKYVASEKIPHSYGPYTYVCAQNQRKAVCLICGYENVEYLYGGTIHQYQNGVCIYCGQKNNTGTTPGADVHIWDNGDVTLEPTCISNGIKMYTCVLCWQTKGEVIKATGHKYVNSVCEYCGQAKSAETSKVPSSTDDQTKNPDEFDDVEADKNVDFKLVFGAVLGVVLICVIFYFLTVAFSHNSKERNRKRK